MAITQPSWNGPTSENQRSHVRGRQTSENRVAVETVDLRPKIEFFHISAGLSPDVTVSIGYDGKNLMLRGNRRDLMNILRKASEAVFNMEPGAPPDPHK